MNDALTLSPLLAWVGALSLLLNFGLSLWGLLNSGARQNKQKLDELDARIGRHETRLGGVEQALRSLPSAGDLHKIELALSRMEGELGIMVTCDGIFPPSAIRVRPMERTDDEEGTTD